jgi:hypothetical protein
MKSLGSRSAVIAILIGCQPLVGNSSLAPSTGAIRGLVLDSVARLPIQGAQVWVVGQPVGATTDSLGEFRFYYHYGSEFTLLTRLCARENAARTRVSFSHPLSALIIISVIKPKAPCAPLPRPPWEVGPQDTTTFVGYVHYSWEGDTFTTCAGKLFSPQWAVGLRARLWNGRRPKEGEARYVRLQARFVDDPSTRDLVGGPPLYVWRILDVESRGPST